MPPTEVRFSTPPSPRVTPRVRVYTREFWSFGPEPYPWDLQPHLYLDSCVWTANPDMATANFTWHYGRVLHPDTGTWETVEPLDGLRLFVKVEIDRTEEDDENPEPIKWYGILEEDNGEQKGILAQPAGGKGAGRQRLTAYGLDVMLSRHVLGRSTTLDANDNEQTVERAIEFNAKTNYSTADKLETGNRTADRGSRDAYLFAHDLGAAEYWTTLDAAEYLLAHQAPVNEIDDTEIPWKLDTVSIAFVGVVPNWDKPRKACQGRTLRAVLDELLDRRRLLGYTILVEEVTDEVDQIVVYPFTFTPEDIEYEGNSIAANADQKALVFDSDTGLQSALVRKASLQSVHQVICQGARAVACWSLDGSSGSTRTLTAGWEAWQESLYRDGASLEVGYSGWDISQQQQRNAWSRRRDRVKRVYSYFNLPDDWQGLIVPTVPGEGYYFPNADANGPLPFYLPGLRFKNQLPLKTDHDYSGSKIADGAVVNRTPAGQKWEYLPIFAIIAIPDSGGKFQFLDRMAQHTETKVASLGLEDGVPWSASVRPQDDGPGVVISVSGAPQHVLAATGSFSPLAVDEYAGQFDWEGGLIVTVAAEVDLFAEGRWPENPPTGAALRRLVIDLGDEYQLHYVAPLTVVDLDPGGSTVNVTGGGFIRDDRPALTALARLAWEWYHTERASIELAFSYITGKLKVGDLITTIGQGESLETINSVVTMVKMEFSEQEPGGQPPSARTTITTQFAEFDARAFVSSP